MLTVDLITVTNFEFSFGPTGTSFNVAVTFSDSTVKTWNGDTPCVPSN